MYELQGKTVDAIAVYKKALELNPHNADIAARLAQLYIQQNALDEALQQFKQLVSLDPKNYEAYVKMGLIYAEKKQYEPAADAFRTASDAEPYDLKVRRYLASTLRRSNGMMRRSKNTGASGRRSR